MRYLNFEVTEVDAGLHSLEAVASTGAAEHAAVLGEVAQVLAWARQAYPATHGPADEGMDWDDDVQVLVEPGGWHTVSVTLSASLRFAQDLLARFGNDAD